jgi:hypothetical protein
VTEPVTQLLILSVGWLAAGLGFAAAAKRRQWLGARHWLPLILALGPLAWLMQPALKIARVLESRAESRGRHGPNTDDGSSHLGGSV